MVNKFSNLFFDNFATKLASVFIALVLWIIVLFSRSVDISKDIPIQIVTAPEVVVANDIPDRLTFQLSGPKIFLRVVQERAELPIKINLSGMKPGNVTYSIPTEDVRWPPGMHVNSVIPPTLHIRLETIRHGSVKARPDLRGTPAPGYRIARTEIQPPEISIKGARAAVGSLNELVSNPVIVEGLSKTLKQPLTFETSHLGVETEGQAPSVTVVIEPVSPNFKLHNVGVKVLSAHKVQLSDASVTVFVRATADDMKTLDHSQVFSEIDLRGQKKGKYQIPIKITAPKNIGIVKVLPEKVTVTLY